MDQRKCQFRNSRPTKNRKPESEPNKYRNTKKKPILSLSPFEKCIHLRWDFLRILRLDIGSPLWSTFSLNFYTIQMAELLSYKYYNVWTRGLNGLSIAEKVFLFKDTVNSLSPKSIWAKEELLSLSSFSPDSAARHNTWLSLKITRRKDVSISWSVGLSLQGLLFHTDATVECTLKRDVVSISKMIHFLRPWPRLKKEPTYHKLWPGFFREASSCSEKSCTWVG